MSGYDFIVKLLETLLSYLTWPVTILLAIVLLKKPVSELLPRLVSLKYDNLHLDFGQINQSLLDNDVSEAEKKRLKSAQIIKQGRFYTLFSNGLIVQKWNFEARANSDPQFVIFPIAFPNEVLSLAVIGSVDWKVEELSSFNCKIRFSGDFSPAEVEIRAVGM